MSKLQSISLKRNYSFEKLHQITGSISELVDKACFTDWETTKLNTCISELNQLIENKEFGYKGMKVKIKALEAILNEDISEGDTIKI